MSTSFILNPRFSTLLNRNTGVLGWKSGSRPMKNSSNSALLIGYIVGLLCSWMKTCEVLLGHTKNRIVGTRTWSISCSESFQATWPLQTCPRPHLSQPQWQTRSRMACFLLEPFCSLDVRLRSLGFPLVSRLLPPNLLHSFPCFVPSLHTHGQVQEALFYS